jgi:hypothetical protein
MKSQQTRAIDGAPDRPAIRRRANEALVATYIHELSERHRVKPEARQPRSPHEPGRS